MHPHTLIAQWFVTQSEVKQMSLSTSQQHIQKRGGGGGGKPVVTARVPSDSSFKITGAICQCISLLHISALVFFTYYKKLKRSPDHTFNQFKEEET